MVTEIELMTRFRESSIDDFKRYAEPAVVRMAESTIARAATEFYDASVRCNQRPVSFARLTTGIDEILKKGYIAARLTERLPPVKFNTHNQSIMEIYRGIVETVSNGGSSEDNPVKVYFSSILSEFIDSIDMLMNSEIYRVRCNITPEFTEVETLESFFRFMFRKGASLAFSEALARGEILFQLPHVPGEYEGLLVQYIRIIDIDSDANDVIRAKLRVKSVLQRRYDDANPKIRTVVREAMDRIENDRIFVEKSANLLRDSLFEIREKLRIEKHIQALIDSGVAAGNSEKLDEAFLFFADAYTLDSCNPQVNRSLGIAYEKIGLQDEGARYTEYACENDSRWQALAMLDKATFLHRKNKTPQAVELVFQAFDRGSDQTSLFNNYTKSLVEDLVEKGSATEGLKILDLIQDTLGADADVSIHLDIIRFSGFLHLNDHANAKAVLCRIRKSGLLGSMDVSKILRNLRKAGLKTEFLEYVTDVAGSSNPSLQAIAVFEYFHFLLSNAARETRSGLIQQMDAILGYENSRTSDYKGRYLDLILRILLPSLAEQDSERSLLQFLDCVFHNFLNLADRTLMKDSVTVSEIFSVVIQSIGFTESEIKPWPKDFQCVCGANLRDHVFCDCGDRLLHLESDFFERLPARPAACMKCGMTFTAFQCDDCGEVYSWFLSGE